ncbi:hypothetical protein TNCV_2515361 [Trichonephila clavipes]|nr:hypothetical protein TNCV_2515361 [Trichonephila clavipes]
MAVAQSPQLGEVHPWHNQRRPHEEQAGQKCMSKVIQIRHGVAVELSNRIQLLPVIPNRSNCRVKFGHNMKRRTPGTFGRSNNALSKKKFKFYLHCIIQFRCSLLGLAVDWWASSNNMVDCAM